MLKRFLDFFVASCGILGFLPFAILFAIAVKAEDRGPVFFIQERWGKGGQKFRAYKFRSMRHKREEVGFRAAEENDQRITRVGKFLRATAMDELPQLINIWKGDMSFVGPRALALAEVTPEEPRFRERHSVRPGLTGPAQVHASRDATLQQKFDYDLDYVAKMSTLFDLQLMLVSVWVTLQGKWETRQKKF